MPGADKGVIGFAEKLVEILEEGRFTATYKFAVLIALMDLCFEANEASGIAPESLTTRQLAEKIIEIYWAHSVAYPAKAEVLPEEAKLWNREREFVNADVGRIQSALGTISI